MSINSTIIKTCLIKLSFHLQICVCVCVLGFKMVSFNDVMSLARLLRTLHNICYFVEIRS